MNHSFSNIVFAANQSQRCFYCNTGLEGDALLFATVDHLWPDSQFGSNRPANLVPACHSCNAKRGDIVPPEFVLTYTDCEDIKNKKLAPPVWMDFDPFGNIIIKKGSDRERFKKLIFCMVNDTTARHAKVKEAAITILRGGLLTQAMYLDLLNE